MTFSYSSSDEQTEHKVNTEMKLSSTRLQKPFNTLWKTWETETNIELGTVKEHMKVLCTLSRKWYSGKQPRLAIIETAHKTKTHKWSTRLYETEPQLYFTSTNPFSPSQIICFFLSLSLSFRNRSKPFVKCKSGTESARNGEQFTQDYGISIELGVIKVWGSSN